MATFQINAGHISRPRAVGRNQLVTVTPGIGATAKVEYTLASQQDVQNNVATWQNWPKGSITVPAMDLMAKDGFIRITASAGNVSYSVDESTSALVLESFGPDWGSLISTSGIPVQTGITGNATIGSVLSFVTPPGLNYTAIQWYRNGVAISGANSSSYTYQAADVGKVITVELTGISQMSSPLGTQPAGSGSQGIASPVAPQPQVTSWTEDSSGRVSVMTTTVNGFTYTWTYNYDTSSRFSTAVYIGVGVTLTVTYNYSATTGRLTGLTVA